jgi:hypothetical protein
MKLTIREKTVEDMILYIEAVVLPQLKEGYKSGYTTDKAKWELVEKAK